MPILAPTFIDEHEVPFSTSSSPGGSANTGSFSVTAGDLLVILGSTEDSQRTMGTPTGGGLTYTLAQSIVVTNNCTAYAWTAVCTATTSITVTITVAGGSGAKLWGFNVLRFRGAAVGTSAKTNSTGAPTLNITATRENSAIAVINSDWAAVDGASRTWRTNAGAFTEQHYFRDSSSYTTYGGYHANAGTISTDAVGLSAPGGQTYAIIAVEVKGTLFDLGAAASETDTANAITVLSPITVAIGQASETDTANAIAPPSGTTVSVGQASEADTAQAITVVSVSTVAVGQASETDTAQPVTPVSVVTVALGQASETDTAQAISVAAVVTVPVGTASETDTAQSITVQSGIVVSVGQAVETDTAQSITPVAGVLTVAVGQAEETDTGQGITPQSVITVAVGAATETDNAQSITVVSVTSVGTATETDTAQSITPVAGTVTVAVGQSGETDSALDISPVGMGSVLIGMAEETDTAQSITVVSTVSAVVGQATEADTAQVITVVLAPLVIGIDRAGETDSGEPITPVGAGTLIAVGQAQESDTAQSITPQALVSVLVGTAQETDTAQTIAVSSAITVPIDFASEVDAGTLIAVILTVLGIPINGAVESSSAFAFTALTGETTIPIETATEADTAGTITAGFAQSVTLDRAVELDTAGAISVVMASGRVPFSSGPCQDWEPIWCGPLSAAAMAVTGDAVSMATEVLWSLSGQRFGICEVTLRPCRDECAQGFGTLSDWWAGVGIAPFTATGGPRPWWADGVWHNVCGGCTSGCSCTQLQEAILPAPTREVLEVRLNGVVLNPDAYRVDENRRLVRTDGGVWPYCQDMAKNDSEPGTWSVTITVGETVPTLARRAVADLAAEFAKDCAGEECRVPYDVTSLSRQGITLDFGNPNVENIDSLVRLLGLRTVRLFLATYNPGKLRQRGKVYDVNTMPNPWKRVNTS